MALCHVSFRYVTNTADTYKNCGCVWGVFYKLDKTSVSHSLNSVNRQIFQLTTSSIMPRTINEQILYIIGTFFAVKENSSESNLQLFGCHQSRSATVSWTDTWRWCNYRITKLISIRDQKNIPSNQREKKKSKGKSLCRAANNEWKEVKNPAWANTVLMSPDSGTWLRTNG